MKKLRNLEQNLRDALRKLVQKSPFTFKEIWSKYDQEGERKQRRTKRWIAMAIPSIAIVSGVTAIAATMFSHYTSNLETASHAQGIFEYINGTPVTNEQFQSYKVGQKLVAQMTHHTLPSEAEIIHQFNLQQVVYQESQKEHFDVTDNQALDFSLKMQQMIEHPPANANKTSLSQNEEILKAQEKGLGVTDKEYWTQVAPKAYKVAMSIGNLKSHFITTYQSSHPGASFQTAESAWNKYENQLLNDATTKQIAK